MRHRAELTASAQLVRSRMAEATAEVAPVALQQSPSLQAAAGPGHCESRTSACSGYRLLLPREDGLLLAVSISEATAGKVLLALQEAMLPTCRQ